MVAAQQPRVQHPRPAALSIPCDTSGSGLPIGFPRVRTPGADATVLRFGATPEHQLPAA
jgi:Asp-tRNA(Asn)/Glu-tRNA(Gln) amidotransferase A subunit family amidase